MNYDVWLERPYLEQYDLEDQFEKWFEENGENELIGEFLSKDSRYNHVADVFDEEDRAGFPLKVEDATTEHLYTLKVAVKTIPILYEKFMEWAFRKFEKEEDSEW